MHYYIERDLLRKGLSVLSFGAGQDSWAILCRYLYDARFRERYAPGHFLVVMSDTGDEHPETLKAVERAKELCRKCGVEFVHIKPEMGFHSASWKSLRYFYNLKRTVGSKAFPKTCTDKLKIQPIYKFLNFWIADRIYHAQGNNSKLFKRKSAIIRFAEEYGKIRMMIGISKGEERRIADPARERQKWKRETVEMVYPLVDLGMDRAACQSYINECGQIIPPPSNCMLCPFMNEIELLWLYRNYPTDYEDWVRIEHNKLEANRHMGDRNLGVWGRKTLPEKLQEAIRRYGHMSSTELNEYKMSHGHCIASRY